MMSVPISILLIAQATSGCWASSRPIEAGDVITQDDVHSVECREAVAEPMLRIDPVSRNVQARVALQAHDYIGRAWVPRNIGVRRGDSVQLVAQMGVTEVRRTVRALQAAAPGQSFFVMDADGNVFAAPPLATVDESSP